MKSAQIRNGLWLAILIALFSANAAAQDRKPIDPGKARVIEHWTKERRANAIPRDFVIDPRGLGYMRRRDGSLEPYGHDIAAQATQRNQIVSPFGKPVAGDTGPTAFTNMDPAAGTAIGASKTFSVNVTDPDGIRSVTFKIWKGSSTAQSFSATNTPGTDTWSVALQGFTDGADWHWQVEAKDGAARGGNTATSTTVDFTVNTGGGGSGGGTGAGTVTNAQWTSGGTVQTAAGRLFFEMPNNKGRKMWTGYVCSGTVATDATSGRSVIITAAHCVYDDANKAFARNVMFIPNQAGTSGSGTDSNCGNDPLGCWVPSFGVVDVEWTTRKFPANIAWDYAYYVVNDSGAHSPGLNSTSEVLDTAAGSLPVSFGTVSYIGGPTTPSPFTYALGYSYSEDPKFMYCAENMTTEGSVNWWLPSCLLSGGSSGGPWVQSMDKTAGSGPIISVNSWGYTNRSGMAGPKLVSPPDGTSSASCVFGTAKSKPFSEVSTILGDAGVAVTCP